MRKREKWNINRNRPTSIDVWGAEGVASTRRCQESVRIVQKYWEMGEEILRKPRSGNQSRQGRRSFDLVQNMLGQCETDWDHNWWTAASRRKSAPKSTEKCQNDSRFLQMAGSQQKGQNTGRYKGIRGESPGRKTEGCQMNMSWKDWWHKQSYGALREKNSRREVPCLKKKVMWSESTMRCMRRTSQTAGWGRTW